VKRRGTLGTRIALVCVAIAVVTGVVAGGLAVGLIRTTENASARRVLSQLADTAQAEADKGARPLVEARRLTVLALTIRFGEFGASGAVQGNAALARNALSAKDLAAVRAGKSISRSGTVSGKAVYIEARPVSSGGGVVLVQRRSDADAGAEAAIRRTLLAILLAVVLAVLIGLLVARRLSRPLRRTAEAAHALAAGRRDVTVAPEGPAEVAEVAEAINTLAAALWQSESRQRDFLMSVSHDLRTPLTAINGYAESLAEGVVPPENTAHVGEVLLGESKRLQRLVGDLLDLARLGAQDFRIELADADITGLAQSAAQVWYPRCRDVGVVFRLEAGPARAYTDAARLRQVLDGLLENALRMTPAGAPIVLAVGTERDGGVRCEVRDGGPGLAEEDLAVAFDRSELYRRYQGVRQVGTGLGLAIVHGLVTRLGGTVEAGHAPEGGARFTVRLPPQQPR
jgi:two-component system sensor histidine kinase BaeS